MTKQKEIAAYPHAIQQRLQLSGRVVVVAVVGIAFNAWLIATVEVGKYITLGSMWSLSPLVLTEMLLLLLLTQPLGCFPRWRWEAGDYLTLYILLTIGTTPMSFDGTHALTGLLGFPFSPFARRPEWSEELFQHLPLWAVVSDKDAANAFVLGGHGFWSEGLWRAWWKPIAGWTGLLVMVSMVYIGLSCLLHRQWSQRQRLAFPLVIVPIALFKDEPTLWRYRLFWAGALLATGLSTLNRWRQRYPLIPAISLVGINQFPNPFTERPWSALGILFFGCPLWMFGMAYLVPLDVLFSAWFCYWVWRLVPVAAAAMGLDTSQWLRLFEASYGAYSGLGLSALWLARGHLWTVAKQGLGHQEHDNLQEPLPYRLAALLLAAGALGIWGWSKAMGLSGLFAIAFFGLFFLAAVTVARIRAELGAAIYGMLGMGPPNMLWRTVGVQPFTLTDWTVGMGLLTYGLTYGQRSNLMALQVESLKVAERVGGASPALTLGMVWAAGLGTLLSLVFAAVVFTHRGALAGRISIGYHNVFVWGYNALHAWRVDPPKFNAAATTAVGVGVAVTLMLQVLRVRFVQFPLHPLGFAIAADYNCHFFWTSLFFAWLVKGLLLRYGGLSAHRSFLPFCLGLVIGDFVTMVLNGLALAITDLRVQELTL